MKNRIINQWIEAFNSKNLELLLSLYHENAAHLSPKLRELRPETNGLIHGKAALRDWWLDAFERLPTLTYMPLDILVADDSVFLLYRRHVEGESTVDVGELFKFEGDLIIKSRVFHG